MVTFSLLLITTPCLFYLSLSNDYPSQICIIGDVSVAYIDARDPRSFMGTYHVVDDNGTNWAEEIVNTSYPVYEHIPYQYGTRNDPRATPRYLFRVTKEKVMQSNGAWVLSDELPTEGASIAVYFTCFRENLFECIYNRWFWGFGTRDNLIPTLEIQSGECNENMCIENLTLNPNGLGLTSYAGEFNRAEDANTSGYKWVNQRNPLLTWTYRSLEYEDGGYSYNWVYKEDGADRVACAPGSADMPLFCSTFVYAGDHNYSRSRLGLPPVDGGTTVFKIGLCRDTQSPTVAIPTGEPTMQPTMQPSAPTEVPTTVETVSPTSAPSLTEPNTSNSIKLCVDIVYFFLFMLIMIL